MCCLQSDCWRIECQPFWREVRRYWTYDWVKVFIFLLIITNIIEEGTKMSGTEAILAGIKEMILPDLAVLRQEQAEIKE